MRDALTDEIERQKRIVETVEGTLEIARIKLGQLLLADRLRPLRPSLRPVVSLVSDAKGRDDESVAAWENEGGGAGRAA
jgi:hypothetical protein